MIAPIFTSLTVFLDLVRKGEIYLSCILLFALKGYENMKYVDRYTLMLDTILLKYNALRDMVFTLTLTC